MTEQPLTERPLDGVRTIDQVLARARALASPHAYRWAEAAAGEGRTRDRNRDALTRLAVVPRLLAGLDSVSTGTSLLGVDLDLPVVLAPVGSTALHHPDGAVAAAEGARRAGTVAFCGFMATAPWADVAAVDPGRQFFQLYPLGDRAWLSEVVDRVEAAGFAGICLTADSPVAARRDSLIESGTDWRLEREDLTVNLAGLGRHERQRRRFGWADLEWLCARTRLPVALKGVLRGADADRGVGCGAAAIWVSNHGGRTVDHGPATIEVLPEVVEAVAGRAQVVVDGGFTRGVEVAKALALGARAVAVGRLHLWGLTIGGAAGVALVLDILRRELSDTMAFLGAATPADLDPGHVR
ncbi:alpha-hydroxy acid oxidase [Phytohabitans suffuscus]|uniref:Alpha-hydroxy-acid oxidizing enzyme n=1 Tax=Phytohabitans suffuscus TaxID=624315 RepID=A0A6F8YYT8_9ACTN|nr:alpha-hydroxy acid oxidase [Phytohabitans suffuscus]BCB91335.1 alpha-hydroxy-acid oxidizing enzyme [Phytohabitans suffuscus]